MNFKLCIFCPMIQWKRISLSMMVEVGVHNCKLREFSFCIQIMFGPWHSYTLDWPSSVFDLGQMAIWDQFCIYQRFPGMQISWFVPFGIQMKSKMIKYLSQEFSRKCVNQFCIPLRSSPRWSHSRSPAELKFVIIWNDFRCLKEAYGKTLIYTYWPIR